MLRIAVLSDLHITTNDNQLDKVLDKIQNFFDEFIIEEKKIDIVVVPGDLTSEGKKEQFNRAYLFFESIRQNLGLERERFVFCPGNHDFDRSKIDALFNNIRMTDLASYKVVFSSDTFLNHCNEVFENYCAFIKRFYKKKEQPHLYYSNNFKTNDFLINIAKINSCLTNPIAGDSLPAYICEELINDNFENKKNFDFSILVQHHPPMYLQQDNRIRFNEKLEESFDILITGHEHRSDSFTQRRISSKRECSVFICGCAYLNKKRNPEKYSYGFSIIEYNLVKGKGKRVHYSADSNVEFFSRDTHVCKEARINGELPFIIKEREDEYLKSKGFDPLDRINITENMTSLFKTYQKKILTAKKGFDLKKIRLKVVESPNISIKDLALYFLKYLLITKQISDFDLLKKSLNEVFILKSINRYHDRILEYYDESYFNRFQEDAITQLSKQRKNFQYIELLSELEETKSELKRVRGETVSILELYKNKPIEMLPPLPEEQETIVMEDIEWFKRMKLTEDPFPSQDGLENIEPELYENVVFQTSLIKQLKDIVLNNTKFLLNKKLCINGAFGSGKTTLFQYLKRLLTIHNSDLLAVLFSLDGRKDVREIRRKFFQKLRYQLAKKHYLEFKFYPEEKNAEEDCFNILNTLSTKKTGLIIFIEDIYKHSSTGEYMEEVVNFITSLQIIRKDFTEIIPTSFLFSAIDELVKRISGDRATSGSVDDYYHIPNITIDEACEMINLRIKAFSVDPDNPPLVISRNYLSRLIKIEKHPGRPVKTFRDYLEILSKRLKRHEFTEKSISIRSNDYEIQNALNDMKQSHHDLFERFQELKKRTKSNRDTFERMVKILEDIWLGEELIEGEETFSRDRNLVVHLYSLNFLIKAKRGVKYFWIIDKKCDKYFNKIRHIYSIDPVNIIPSLFFIETDLNINENEIIIKVENLVKRGEEYGASFLRHLKNAAQGYSKIYQFSMSLRIARDDLLKKFDLDVINDSFSALVMAFVIQCDLNVINYQEALFALENSWYEIEEATYFAKLIKKISSKMDLTGNEIEQFISEYFRSFERIISRLQRFVQWDNWFTLKNKSIWNGNKDLLNNIRRNLESNTFDKAYYRIQDILANRLRDFILDYSRILFGGQKWKRGLSEKINKKIKDYRSSIPIESISKGEILLNLSLRDLFKCVDFLAKDKTKDKISYLSKVRDLCKEIEEVLSNKQHGKNPWSFEILELIEELDQFYYLVLMNKIPTSWNSTLLNEFTEMKQYSEENSCYDDLLPLLKKSELIFDSRFKLKKFSEKPFKFTELIFTISNLSLKNTIEISVNYKKEEILIALNKNRTNPRTEKMSIKESKRKKQKQTKTDKKKISQTLDNYVEFN